MARAIKLSDELVEIAVAEGRVMRRSAGAQVEYWARLGRSVEESGVVGPGDIRRLLAGQGSVQDLTAGEDALYMDALTQKLESLDGSDTRHLEALRAGGHPVAYENSKGEVVVEELRHPKNSKKSKNSKNARSS